MKKNNIKTEEQKEIKKFIIILLAILLIVGCVYFITDKFIEKGDYSNTIPGSINYDRATIGTMLNRHEEEYYVFIYNSTKEEASYYSSLINKYQNKEEALKVYFIDLNNELNKDYYNVNNDNISNKKAKTIKELDLGDITLIQVKNNNISMYEDDISKIENLLK